MRMPRIKEANLQIVGNLKSKIYFYFLPQVLVNSEFVLRPNWTGIVFIGISPRLFRIVPRSVRV